MDLKSAQCIMELARGPHKPILVWSSVIAVEEAGARAAMQGCEELEPEAETEMASGSPAPRSAADRQRLQKPEAWRVLYPDTPARPARKKDGAKRWIAELVEQAASVDTAPAHEAPLVRQLRRKRRAGHGPRLRKEPLSVQKILAWADAHYQREGRWPSQYSGVIPEAPGENWRKVQVALREGLRGLSGGSTVARLLAEHRGVPHLRQRPDLTVEQILTWADRHHACTGKWPTQYSGVVFEAPHESWPRIDAALRDGRRGLPGGSSLPQLLAECRAVRNIHTLPLLTEEMILAWADAYLERHDRWPSGESGRIEEAPGETWNAVDLALKVGRRGLPGGSSLAQLLAEGRGRRNRSALPPYTVKEILAWADAYRARHSHWPTAGSGPIEEAPGESWNAVDRALRNGVRGFLGGSSLPRLLEKHRGVRNIQGQPPLTEKRILAWADAYYERHRMWPNKNCGVIPGTVGETWASVDNALHQGNRGLPGHDSLAKLLARHRGKTQRRRHDRPTLTEGQILAWADAWFTEYGGWPSTRDSRPIPGADGENWNALDVALKLGYRGLPGGDSVARLLRRHGRK
jgi:hypothetical protein